MHISGIGVMQGRLLPKYQGRYQAHPIGYWEQEFQIARDCGLDLIEFILDYNEFELNPLMSIDGLRKIASCMENTGVQIKSVCADYFMEAPFHNTDFSIISQSQDVLKRLIYNSSQIGIRDIVIPCVDNSSLGSNSQWHKQFVHNILPAITLAEALGVNLALETDLAPEQFVNLLNKLPSANITVNYDTGNSAALGYNPVEELATYGSRISDIHIKDRICQGGSVRLGTGNTDFVAFFSELKRLDFNGPIILQAYRDDQGVDIFQEQLLWFKQQLKIYGIERGKV